MECLVLAWPEGIYFCTVYKHWLESLCFHTLSVRLTAFNSRACGINGLWPVMYHGYQSIQGGGSWNTAVLVWYVCNYNNSDLSACENIVFAGKLNWYFYNKLSLLIRWWWSSSSSIIITVFIKLTYHWTCFFSIYVIRINNVLSSS